MKVISLALAGCTIKKQPKLGIFSVENMCGINFTVTVGRYRLVPCACRAFLIRYNRAGIESFARHRLHLPVMTESTSRYRRFPNILSKYPSSGTIDGYPQLPVYYGLIFENKCSIILVNSFYFNETFTQNLKSHFKYKVQKC